jgi:sensor histidine kinase YesM
MKVRMGARLSYTLDLPEALKQHSVPPLLLQPLVENSIQHGLEPKVAGGSISVRAHATADARLEIEVLDTGLGLPGSGSSRAGSGFGLRQVRERLSTLYGSQGAMLLEAADAGGTRASITFPLKK